MKKIIYNLFVSFVLFVSSIYAKDVVSPVDSLSRLDGKSYLTFSVTTNHMWVSFECDNCLKGNGFSTAVSLMPENYMLASLGKDQFMNKMYYKSYAKILPSIVASLDTYLVVINELIPFFGLNEINLQGYLSQEKYTKYTQYPSKEKTFSLDGKEADLFLEFLDKKFTLKDKEQLYYSLLNYNCIEFARDAYEYLNLNEKEGDFYKHFLASEEVDLELINNSVVDLYYAFMNKQIWNTLMLYIDVRKIGNN